MVNLNAMPCSECVYCGGIKQPDGTEKTEYVVCNFSKSGKANELLILRGDKLSCDYREKD